MALERFGFGHKFKKYAPIPYTNIESCLINNDTSSEYFALTSGIRKGCPLSALLVVISVKVFSITLKNNDLTQRFELGCRNFKITQLADDTTLFLKIIELLKEAITMLGQFKNISELKLKQIKSEILQI